MKIQWAGKQGNEMRSWALVVGLVLLFACADGMPPLEVTQSEEEVEVAFPLLGEYPTEFTRGRLTRVSDSLVLWDVTTTRTEKLHKIDFFLGENSVWPTPDEASYAVSVPAELRTFKLAPGVEYEIEIWGANGTSKRATFSFAE